MKYVSLFSGIEAASVAWSPLGWTPMAFAEVDPFCCSVLSHRYPGVPNLGDVTQVEIQPGTADVVVGGSPCQSFSVAGKRIGLDDPRGNLALVYIRVVRHSRARWMVYENVPGLLSSGKGDDFAAFLSALTGWDIPAPDGPWKNSGIIPQRTADDYGIAYRILDAQYSGVPQRRRRVFVVGHLGDWRRAAAVLFERHSLSGDPPPSRDAGTVVTSALTCSLGSGGADAARAQAGHLIPRVSIDSGQSKWHEGCGPLTAHDAKDGYCSGLVTHTLRGDGFDASEDGTGRGTPLVPVQAYQCHGSNVGPMGTLRAGNGNEAGGVPFIVSSAHSCEVESHARQADTVRCLDQSGGFAANQGGTVVAVPFDTTQITSAANYSNPQAGDPCHPLAAGAHPPAIAFHANQDPISGEISPCLPTHHGNIAVAFRERGRDASRTLEWQEDVAYCQDVRNGGGAGSTRWVAYQWAVRRLTPRECERLQGFPDDWTLVPFRGKPAADGPRYRAIGNSIAVPVIRWIGERIQIVEAIG